ncbi:MAG TPA: GNAT family N-acetyltransferase [Candidatus Paceibacterota bacterium]|nr:GNAT family N-acetyltransferase [Candidatus Paceibacterota bacterium]
MEFQKEEIDGTNLYYWTWKDNFIMPYAWLEKKDLKKLPEPCLIIEIHPDCPIGLNTKEIDEFTNIIELPDSFEKIKINNDLRKDLKRVEKKNENVKIVYNEKDALEKSKKWFLEIWKEDKEHFKRRMKIWKEKCYTLSAYLNNELIAVHIAMKEKDTIYYCACWWNRKYKSLSTPVFLLKKDIEQAIKDGMKYYDLEVGDEPYKKKWGVIERPTKYYAVLTKELAEHLEIDNYTEIKENKKVRLKNK